MQFTDLFFLFCFVPIALLVSFLEKSTEYKNFILIISSILFFSWGRPFIVSLIFATILFDWLFGYLASGSKGKALSVIALAADFLMNVSTFVLFSWNHLFKDIDALTFSDKLIPIGIAFYGIRGFSYVFDCYTKKIPAEKNIFCLLTYALSFPLMVIGPVVRYGEISGQIRKRSLTGEKINSGLTRIILGLAKVVIVVPVCAAVKAAGLNPDEITISGSWLGILAYICQFCYTWSGYTDIAIGLGKLFGFDYPENFTPFRFYGYVKGFAGSFNKTLNGFASDVIIKPFKEKSKLFGYLGVIICGAAIGVWYSPTKFFLAAGLITAILIILEDAFLKKVFDNIMPMFSWLYMTVVMTGIFAITCFDSLGELKHWALGLIGREESYILSVALKGTLSDYAIVIAVTALASLPFSRKFFKEKITIFSDKSLRCYGAVRIAQTIILCLLLVLSTISIASNTIPA